MHFVSDKLIPRMRSSNLFKDSFWAVMGNGIGNAFMLFSGILIARYLGKDLYGAYGMVKTTMFHIALYATFALGNTSTKFIAEYIQRDVSVVPNIVMASIRITLVLSISMCICLLLFAGELAVYINAPQLTPAFRFLGIVIVSRALNTVGAGILGGFKEYKRLGINNVIAGIAMMSLCIPLTRLWGLSGALWSLLVSQILLCILNLWEVRRVTKKIHKWKKEPFSKKLLLFSYPFAIAELVYTIASLGTNLLVTKYATIGDFGIYTACSQWNSIVLFMPGLLGNVILSYLSTSVIDKESSHAVMVKRMLLINLLCTVAPFLLVMLFSPYIVAYYGPTFSGMERALIIMTLGAIFTCMTQVFQSDLTSCGRKWTALLIRGSYNILQLVLVLIVLPLSGGSDAAIKMAYISVFVSLFALILYASEYLLRKAAHMKRCSCL